MSRANIIVVEDNLAEVEVLRLALDHYGHDYELRVLHDGADALDFVTHVRALAQDLHPCVILLDIHLPKHDGLEVLEAIRHEPALRHIPVVVFAGVVSPAERKRILALGALCHTKPFHLNGYIDLAALLFSLCGYDAVAA